MQGKVRFSREARGARDEFLVATGYLLLFVLLLRGSSLLSPYLAGMGLAWGRYLLSPLAYVIPLLMALFSSRGKRGAFFALPKKRALADVLPLLPLFLGAVMAMSHLTSTVLDALGLTAVGGGVAGLGFLPDLLLNCLLPAALEELFFRGLILSLLWRRMGSGGIWLSAIVFAISHGSLYQLPYAFVGGLFLSLSAVVSGSVLVPFLFHFANNFLSLALQYTPRAWGFGGVLVFLLYALVAVGMILSVLYLCSKRETAAGEALSALFALPSEQGHAVLGAAVSSPLALYLIPMLIFALWRAFL